MNRVDFSGSHVLGNSTNIRNLKGKGIFPTEKVNW